MHYQESRILRRLRATNENASSFASKIPTITKPTNDGVLDLVTRGNIVPKEIMLWPILLGSDDDVSSMRILGWNRVLLDTFVDLWMPTVIGEFSCIAGAAVGIAGAAVLNTEHFCDTITPVAARIEDRVIGAGTAVNSDVVVCSPAGDLIGHIVMPLRAFELLEITSDQTTNTPTFNCLYRLLG